ncbi:hypothetical protein [Hyphomicrobium sp.]|uniref:helix-turn-helix transcriptional regulator n=1 Tax=Hyphomicrobium sp. TaxID=82 RepID=UPI002C84C9D5|nr:hypothetical protein [Hyphomicrobium sp.]HRQ25652.1 hypothetical protein [Hyphomicrobium sp.]
MTARELAARWRVTSMHLANLRRQKKGPPFLKLGAAIRYRASEIIAFELNAYSGAVGPAELSLAVMNLPDITQAQRTSISHALVAALFPRR